MLLGAQLAVDLTVDDFAALKRLAICISEEYGLFELQNELVFLCRVYREEVGHEEINLQFQFLVEVAYESVVLYLYLL